MILGGCIRCMHDEFCTADRVVLGLQQENSDNASQNQGFVLSRISSRYVVHS